MPSSNLIIKDGALVENTWSLLDAYDAENSEKVILPLADYLEHSESLKLENTGVWLSNDVVLTDIVDQIISLPLIAIHFPAFMDGRGFSLARLLRERYGYQGEIRAVGHVIRDQLTYLRRCGFTAFEFDESVDIEAALESLHDFTEAYQTSVDFTQPLFRRRA